MRIIQYPLNVREFIDSPECAVPSNQRPLVNSSASSSFKQSPKPEPGYPQYQAAQQQYQTGFSNTYYAATQSLPTPVISSSMQPTMEPIYETRQEDTLDWPLITGESPMKQEASEEFDELACEEQIDYTKVSQTMRNRDQGPNPKFE